MDFSEISISTKRNSTDSGSDNLKLSKTKYKGKEYYSKKIKGLHKIKIFNSFQLLLNRSNKDINIDYQNKEKNINKYFHDKNIENIYRNLELNIIFIKSYVDNRIIKLNNCTNAKNNKNNLNNKVNKNEKKDNISPKDTLSLNANINKKKYIDYSFSKKNYCNYFPKKIEMNFKPCAKPSLFPNETFLGINKFKNEIGSKEYLELKDKIFCCENDSYKIIEKQDHSLLGHFLQKDNKINSIVIRYRHKNSTFIYYK